MRFLVLLALLVILSGCSSPSEPEAKDPDRVLSDPTGYFANHYCVKNDIDRVYAPDDSGTPWQQGDYWRYHITAGEYDQEVELVYYDDQDIGSDGVAAHYMVGTSREDALEHALFSVNPVLGRIHRALYSPHEGGVHADMFNFPLCHGNVWTTKFFDTTFELRVQAQGDNFVIKGTGDASRIEYTYSPSKNWFTALSLEREDGFQVNMELKASGSGKSGQYHFLRAQQDLVADLTLDDETFTFTREAGGDGAYDLLGIYMELERTVGGQEVKLELLNPSGEVTTEIVVPGNLVDGQPAKADPVMTEVDFAAGTWTARITNGPLSEIAGELRVVSMYDRGGRV